MDYSNLLLWAIVIFGSAYAGYCIGRWSVLHDGTLDEFDEPTAAPYREYAGEEITEETTTLPKGLAAPPQRQWEPRAPQSRSAKPPPALAGQAGDDGGSTAGAARRSPSSSAKPPPAAAGLKSS